MAILTIPGYLRAYAYRLASTVVDMLPGSVGKTHHPKLHCLPEWHVRGYPVPFRLGRVDSETAPEGAKIAPSGRSPGEGIGK